MFKIVSISKLTLTKLRIIITFQSTINFILSIIMQLYFFADYVNYFQHEIKLVLVTGNFPT